MAAGPGRLSRTRGGLPTGDLISAGRQSGLAALAGGLVFLALALFALSCVGRQALSWRRSSGERRQQLKWLMAGGAITLTCLLVSVVVGNAPGLDRVLSDVLGVGLVAIPLAIGVGISKYRLYDIDRLRRRVQHAGTRARLVVDQSRG